MQDQGMYCTFIVFLSWLFYWYLYGLIFSTDREGPNQMSLILPWQGVRERGIWVFIMHQVLLYLAFFKNLFEALFQWKIIYIASVLSAPFFPTPFHAKQEATPQDCRRITAVNECPSVAVYSVHSGWAAALTWGQECDLDVRQKSLCLCHIAYKTVWHLICSLIPLKV